MKIDMNPKSKGLFNLFHKKKKNEYKYDKIIDEKLNLLNKINNDEDFKIGKFKVKRKIPNKKELSKVYNNFIKEIHKLDLHKTNNCKFNYSNNIPRLKLTDDNQYLLFKLNLNDKKKYNLSLTFGLEENIKLTFIFINNIEKKIYKVNKEIIGNVSFKTNNMILENNYLEFYVLFSPKNNIIINDLYIEIKETLPIFNYDITLLKNNNKTIIFNS